MRATTRIIGRGTKDGRARRWPALLVLGLAVLMGLWSVAPAAVAAETEATTQGIWAPLPRMGSPVPDRWLVVFRDEAVDTGNGSAPGSVPLDVLAADLAARYGVTVVATLRHALGGLVAEMPDWRAKLVEGDPRVAFIERDRWGRVAGTQEDPPSWALDRVDQRSPFLDGLYRYDATGRGVHVFVLDTGIAPNEMQLGQRLEMSLAYDAVTGRWDATDCNGHGTAVAGIVGSALYGVAKEVTLHPVRVAQCDGSVRLSDVIAGIDWVVGVTGGAADGARWSPPVTEDVPRPAVINLSLELPASDALDAAVRAAMDLGITVVAAAGNSAADACERSPGRVAGVLTVAATDPRDRRIPSSNFGPCVDLFAPGYVVPTLRMYGTRSIDSLTGTSAAAALVSGVAALYLERNPEATPVDVAAELVRTATPGVVTGEGPGSPDRLLYSLLSSYTLGRTF